MLKTLSILSLFIVTLIVAGCAQETIDPTLVNRRIVRVETIKPTGAVAQNVEIALYEDNSPDAALLSPRGATTGTLGYVEIPVDIPTFGHTYLLHAKKMNDAGTLVTYSRTIYPLFLTCNDTIIRLIIPEADTSVTRDSLCGKDEARTFVLYACADSSVTINYQLTNCSGTSVTVTGPSDPAFTITPVPSGGILPTPNGVLSLSITYNGAAHITDASTQVMIRAADGSTMTLTLIGHIRQDCAESTKILQCGVSTTYDRIDFGTVCENEPAGPRCIPFQNTTNSPITITLPQPASGAFFYTSADDNGRAIAAPSTFVLEPGKSMTVCVSLTSPRTFGTHSTDLIFPFSCNGQQATFTIPVSARDSLCNTCNCSEYFHDPFTLSRNIEVGSDTTVVVEFYRNDLDCPVTINDLKLTTQTAWQLMPPLPALPAEVLPGQSLQCTLYFKPTKAGRANDQLTFTITPKDIATPCPGSMDIIGGGCNDACAELTMPSAYHASTTGNRADTLFLTKGGNDIFVSTANAQSTSDEECVRIHYPDTACAPKTIVVSGPTNPMFQVTTSPSPLTLSPGADGTICVRFTAPDIQRIRKDFTVAGQEMKYTDHISIIDPSNCRKDIPIKAVVDTLPGCTDFTLAIYDAATPQQPIPYHQVFRYADQRIITPFPNPQFPTEGDLYVLDNSAQPDLEITNPSAIRGLYLWTTAPFQDVCANKQLVTQSVQSLINSGSASFTASIPDISVNDIIVVALSNGAYSVLLVNGVSDGSNFSDGITHVAFRVLYPVFN